MQALKKSINDVGQAVRLAAEAGIVPLRKSDVAIHGYTKA